MGDIIYFADEAPRARCRRANRAPHHGLGPADWFWLATIPVLPICVAVLAAQTMIGLAFDMPRERR